MKVKVISGIVASAMTLAVLGGFFTPIIDVAVIVLTMLAVYELDHAFGLKYKPLYAISILFGGLVTAYTGYKELLPLTVPIGAVLTGYVILMFLVMLIGYEHIKFEQVGLSILGSLILPYAMGCTLSLKYLYQVYPEKFSMSQSFFLVFFVLSTAIFTDTFAFFSGVKLGKHKLCPKISPKKTVEGAVGGILGTLVMNLAILFVFNRFIFPTQMLSYIEITIMTIILSGVSMIGDLTASAIKRAAGIKDFSNLIPGHGGIMDRFDSISFVMPTVYAMVTVYIVNN